jgi:hypothetical protein
MKKKLIIAFIVGLSLTLAQTSFAALTINLDPSLLSDGTYTSGSPGLIPTAIGNVEFVGQIRNNADPDLPSGKVFDVDDSTKAASLTFTFPNPVNVVTDITFNYGGNEEKITVEAWDNSSTPVLLDSLVNADTTNGASTGPVTLSGDYIYKLTWKDPGGSGPFLYDLASLQNVSLEVIPAPGAVLLGSIGVGLVGWLRRRRTL